MFKGRADGVPFLQKSYKSIYRIIMILKKVQKDKSPENTMDYDASSVFGI